MDFSLGKGMSEHEGGGGAPGKQNFCKAWLRVPHPGFGVQRKVRDAGQVGSDLCLVKDKEDLSGGSPEIQGFIRKLLAEFK